MSSVQQTQIVILASAFVNVSKIVLVPLTRTMQYVIVKFELLIGNGNCSSACKMYLSISILSEHNKNGQLHQCCKVLSCVDNEASVLWFE